MKNDEDHERLTACFFYGFVVLLYKEDYQRKGRIMGYYSTINGHINITFYSTEAIKNFANFIEEGYYYVDRYLDDPDEIEAMKATIGESQFLNFESVEAAKYYQLTKKLQDLVNMDGVEVNSIDVTRYGEDAGDIEHYILRNGKVVSCKAVLTFPDENYK